MYDPETDELIRLSPDLAEFDLDDLPRLLTEHYAEIVSYRLALHDASSSSDPAALQRLRDIQELLQRLAATYEVVVAILPAEDERRRSAAFVAGTAHQLLDQIRATTTSESPEVAGAQHLLSDRISPRLAAMLLFQIAGAFPDAAQVAASLQEQEAESGCRNQLVQALRHLARGELNLAAEASADLATPNTSDLLEQATDALYIEIAAGVNLLAQELREGPDVPTNDSSSARFSRVRDLAAESWNPDSPFQVQDLPLSRVLGVVGGPRHLATLLLATGDTLRERAIGGLPPPDGVEAEGWRKFVRRLSGRRPLLWPNHLRALDSGFLTVGVSSVVTFPTGAGKSTLVELKIASALHRSKPALFLVPTHALEEQVRRDLYKTFPGFPVGRLVSEEDVTEEGEQVAQILIMTPERCLAVLGFSPEQLAGLGVVVFDECHLMHPDSGLEDRRSLEAMFCLLGLLQTASDADFVLLSAMVENASQLAGWLSGVTARTCLALDIGWKPTRQARGCVVYQTSEVVALRKKIKAAFDVATTKGPPASLKRDLWARAYGLLCLRQQWTNSSTDYLFRPLLPGDGLTQLTSNPLDLDDGKTVWTLSSNRYEVAAAIAANLAKRGMKTLALSQVAKGVPSFAKRVADHLATEPSAVLTEREQELHDIAAAELGDASHVLWGASNRASMHFGAMLPVERQLSESVFKREGGCGVIVASPTMTMGVNLPAEAVVIAGDDRWDPEKEEPQPLTAPELLNAAGRAGRAGSCAQGLVLVVPGRVVSTNLEAREIAQRWLELQQNVFSKSDQCLVVDDPVELWLDELQDVGTATTLSAEARYFITRLPVGPEERDEAAKRFLRSSLGAYIAAQAGEDQPYTLKIRHVLKLREELSPPSPATWHDDLASLSGIPSSTVAALDAALQSVVAPRALTTLEWLDWLFEWFATDSDRARQFLRADRSEKLFYQRKKSKKREAVKRPEWGSTVLKKLQQAARLWMTGRPLRELELLFNTPADELKKCARARAFVTDIRTDLSFAAGIVARVLRAGSEDRGGPTTEIPAALRALSGCIREGLDTPDKLALSTLLEPESWRTSVHTRFAEIEPSLGGGAWDESIWKARQRVRAAMREQSQ